MKKFSQFGFLGFILTIAMFSGGARKLGDAQFRTLTVTSSLGGSGSSYLAKSADYTILDNDNGRVIGMTTSNTTRVVTLPTASDNANRILTIKKVDSGTGLVTIDGEGSETIDGALTQTLTYKNDQITLVGTGTAWESIDRRRSLVARTNWVDNTVLLIGTAPQTTGLTNPPTSVNYAWAMAERDSNGQYWIEWVVNYQHTNGTSSYFRMAGTSFSIDKQAFSASDSGGGATGQAFYDSGSTAFRRTAASSFSEVMSSGRTLASGKPAWFDANIEP